MSITGAGSATVIDDPGAAYGGRLISVAPDAVVHLQGLALNGEHHAAGILESSGVLTLDDVSVEGAYSEYPAGGAALDVEPGSGSSAVSVLDSTFANDQSTGSGGAIDVEAPLINGQPVSTLQIADSTFSGDIAGIGGGALHSLNAGVGLFNTTIAGNTDPAVDVQHAPLTLGNTLIAANGASGDGYPECEAQAVDDDGHNLLGRPGIEGCASVTNGANGDQVGTDAAPINPLLGALAKNGGQTLTRALLAGSPAISGGSAAICLASPVSGLDQRGKSRNPGSRGACDIGAYDTGKILATLYVSSAAGTDPSCAAASKTAPFATIAGALGCALSGDAISVGRGKFAGAFTVGANVSITGAGSATVIDDPGAAYGRRLISVAPDAIVHLQGLALNGERHAAGILESSGELTLDDVSVEGAYSEYPAGGAGLDVEPGSGSSAVSVLDSTFANDQSTGSGGAIDVEAPLINGQPVSTLQIADSTFSGDIAGIGGGALHSLNAGVGLFNTTMPATPIRRWTCSTRL